VRRIEANTGDGAREPFFSLAGDAPKAERRTAINNKARGDIILNESTLRRKRQARANGDVTLRRRGFFNRDAKNASKRLAAAGSSKAPRGRQKGANAQSQQACNATPIKPRERSEHAANAAEKAPLKSGQRAGAVIWKLGTCLTTCPAKHHDVRPSSKCTDNTQTCRNVPQRT